MLKNMILVSLSIIVMILVLNIGKTFLNLIRGVYFLFNIDVLIEDVKKKNLKKDYSVDNFIKAVKVAFIGDLLKFLVEFGLIMYTVKFIIDFV